jgi:hypothetical protein
MGLTASCCNLLANVVLIVVSLARRVRYCSAQLSLSARVFSNSCSSWEILSSLDLGTSSSSVCSVVPFGCESVLDMVVMCKRVSTVTAVDHSK